MLFVEYFLKKNSLKNYKICIFKRNKSCQSVLRAPNKYKKAQVHLKIERFFFLVKFDFLLNLAELNLNILIYLIKKLNNYF